MGDRSPGITAFLAGLLLALAPAVLVRAQEPHGRAQAMAIVERHPAGGLSYQLLLGPADRTERTLRVAVWLHPSGGHSLNGAVMSLAPIFLEHGFAVLLPIDKDFRGWTYEDAAKLLGGTLPDAGLIEGIDLRRPLLFGFSAGGQVALELWSTKPELYGGLILDAAYPGATRDGRTVVFAPPTGDAVRSVPILSFVGEEDPSADLWKRAERYWIEAGVPLTLRVVPALGHAWLFGEEQIRELDAWLGEKFAPAGGQTVAPPQEEPAPAVQP